MALATVFLSVEGPAKMVPTGNVEVLQSACVLPDGDQPINIILRTRPGSKQAELLQTKVKGDLLMVSGTLHLEEALEGIFVPVITASVICKGYEDQYFNEVQLIGNLAKPGRQAEKSCSRSLGESRPVRKTDGDGWDEMTDWFILRGYTSNGGGRSMADRLNDAPKGSLVSVSGTLSQRLSKEKEPYVEVKARRIRVHKRGSNGGGAPDPAAGKAAGGYGHEEFTRSDDMPDNW